MVNCLPNVKNRKLVTKIYIINQRKEIKKMKYKNNGYSIEINLPKKYSGYSVECQYQFDKEKEKYILSMWLKRNDISNRFRIDSQKIDNQYISGTRETIRSNICRIVEQACSSRYFDSFIHDFEKLYECFDKGFELLSKESESNDTK